jgi:carboxyl-terminal processing protease
MELDDHSAVRITTARYYTPSGRSIQRPYGEGIDYDEDMSDRFDHGEFLSADSIHVDSSLKYTTAKGRTVFGGGGIMPDLFVPADTAERSGYLTEVFFSGAINQFAFDLADRQRERLKAFGSAERFAQEYTVSADVMNDFSREAGKLGVKPDPVGLSRSGRLIAERLKAGIARNIWGEAGYYRITIASDTIYKAARAAIDPDLAGRR